MAKLGGFNANDHESLEDFTAIPAGDYPAKLVESERIQNKARTGYFLKLVFQITEGKYKNRKLWSNLNLEHPKAEVVEIANRELATLMKACGKITVDDSEDLHGIEIELKVTKKAATANFPESNEIKNYKALSGVARPSSKTEVSSSEPETSTPKKKSRVSFT